MNPRTQTVYFSSGGRDGLRLEGRLHRPAGGGPFPAAVVAHPHPLHGGSLNVYLISALAQALAEVGCLALRFNFRGVGRSQGEYDGGQGERDDLAGGLDFLAAQPKVDPKRLAVVGYSFGAWVGARVASLDERVTVFAAVAIGRIEAGLLTDYARPKLFIVGDQDRICPVEPLRQFVAGLPEPKQLHVLTDVDHFLVGFERPVAEAVARFVRQTLT